MLMTRPDLPVGGNDDYPWDEFDSDSYFAHNYESLRPDDRVIIEAARDFFAGAGLPGNLSGVDVGTGTNLYPALTLLPFCETIDLLEYSESNVHWLREKVPSPEAASWEPFWRLLARRDRYAAVSDPLARLAERTSIEQGSVFRLPAARWDIGSMFFVAESISTKMSEFRDALHRFLAALRPGAPFAIALMENSAGYPVGRHKFPAVAIKAGDVKECLEGSTEQLVFTSVGAGDNPLRAGYTGMILVCGRRQTI
jgi:hypothetical protein